MEGHAGTYVFIVLVAALKVVHMCSEVGVDDTETSVVKHKSYCHGSLVPLQKIFNMVKFKFLHNNTSTVNA